MKTPEDISRKNPFKVPEGYFENLTERTMASVKENKELSLKTGKESPRRMHLASFLALAAAIIGFAIITTGIIKVATRNDNRAIEKASSEVLTYAINEDIDTYMLENELSQAPVLPAIEETVPSEAIIEYLMLENVDINDIYELL